MVFKKLKRFIMNIGYGGLINVIDEQAKKINSLSKINVELYNKMFDLEYDVDEDMLSVYRGPLSTLKGCKVIKSYESIKEDVPDDMLEVSEFNGFNGGTYYWYFGHSAIDIFPDMSKDTSIGNGKGKLYHPKTCFDKLTADKSIEPTGRKD